MDCAEACSILWKTSEVSQCLTYFSVIVCSNFCADSNRCSQVSPLGFDSGIVSRCVRAVALYAISAKLMSVHPVSCSGIAVETSSNSESFTSRGSGVSYDPIPTSSSEPRSSAAKTSMKRMWCHSRLRSSVSNGDQRSFHDGDPWHGLLARALQLASNLVDLCPSIWRSTTRVSYWSARSKWCNTHNISGQSLESRQLSRIH